MSIYLCIHLRYIMKEEINYAASARKLLGIIKDIDLKNVENLQCYMDNFDHIRMRKGFVLDAFYKGERWGASYNLGNDIVVDPRNVKK